MRSFLSPTRMMDLNEDSVIGAFAISTSATKVFKVIQAKGDADVQIAKTPLTISSNIQIHHSPWRIHKYSRTLALPCIGNTFH